MENLSLQKKILILAGIIAAIFLILNFNYFWVNIKFSFSRPPQRSIPQVQSASSSTPEVFEPNMLNVPSLGIIAPVVYIAEQGETAYQAALINGVVHFPGTANPGQLGNCYIFGHSSDFIWSKGHYKTVFALLPRIQKGAEIEITDPKGQKFIYTVTDSRKVASSDLSVLDQQGNKKKFLTLQTSYPVGTALARWVVIGELKNP